MRKYILFICLVLLTTLQVHAQNQSYTLVVEGFDWGPGASKVVLPMPDSVSSASAANFHVIAVRGAEGLELSPGQAKGERKVLYAYVSDADGQQQQSGTYITLVMLVGPEIPLSSPMAYFTLANKGRNGSQWIDYRLEVTAPDLGLAWDRESRRIMPIVDQFVLDQVYEYGPGKVMNYAYYKPLAREGKKPVIIWLHGGGEGGYDTTIPLMANKAANYASPKIQRIFGGAYVLVPQCPGAWMHNKEGVMTPGKDNDVYNAGLMALIKDFVAGRPDVDTDRIYVGGCSNGGYMSMKLLLLYPDYFAAAYISALAFASEYITDEQIAGVHTPIWFMHSADDQTTWPEKTVLPVYDRLTKAGVDNIHLSFYKHVVDITGLYGGSDYHYNGHLSWIYSHANYSDVDFDGTPVVVNGIPVTVMQWLAAQHR